MTKTKKRNSKTRQQREMCPLLLASYKYKWQKNGTWFSPKLFMNILLLFRDEKGRWFGCILASSRLFLCLGTLSLAVVALQGLCHEQFAKVLWGELLDVLTVVVDLSLWREKEQKWYITRPRDVVHLIGVVVCTQMKIYSVMKTIGYSFPFLFFKGVI